MREVSHHGGKCNSFAQKCWSKASFYSPHDSSLTVGNICRQPDLYESSPASSEYSTGSTLVPHPAVDTKDQIQAEINALHQDIEAELQPVRIKEQQCFGEHDKGSADTNQGN